MLEVNVRERQVSGMKTIQLETCGASAIQCFDKVTCPARASGRQGLRLRAAGNGG